MGDNRWIKLSELIPWEELDAGYYVAQFCKGFGVPAKLLRMALGTLIIKAPLGLTDEELVEQIKEKEFLCAILCWPKRLFNFSAVRSINDDVMIHLVK